ncbi:MAG: VWA domain-containing protein [Gammaproteobacteria bacterium]|nr:VWA domain-containing protein [Gammaproteobacteria bacterium]
MISETVGLHFAQALWLWALLAPLILWRLPFAKQPPRERENRLRHYADPHLMPHLLLKMPPGEARKWRHRVLWSLFWCLGVIAMAGPRWDYRDIEVFEPSSDLVILFDLSQSMQVSDVKPSRLARARQELEDLLHDTRGVRMGLIAFATIAHVVAPITEDTQTIKHLLPSLNTGLVRLPGSRLQEALERARNLLTAQPLENSRGLLLVSDGDFEEMALAVEQVRRLRTEGIHFYALGIGSLEGDKVPSPRGGWIHDRRGNPVVSRLNETQLKALAEAGEGFYFRANYRDDDTDALLERIKTDAPPKPKDNPLRIWHERYYLAVVVMLLLLLLRFRRDRSAVTVV